MNAKKLPANPNLQQYKKQAKDLLKACQADEPSALARIPNLRRRPGSKITLADAQFAVAREHGFESWPAFAKHIQSLTPDSPAAIWDAARNAVISSDAAALESLLTRHAALLRSEQPPPYGSGGLRPDYSSGDARAILLREHHFENWEQFAAYKSALQQNGSLLAQFETAADAIVRGDTRTLSQLLRANPALIHARSTRRHHSTLLHYVASNGVEAFRQKCPKNIVAVTELLLHSGAAVDAEADMYGGRQTTLALAATSIHPLQAAVLIPLLETLLNAGASIDGDIGRSVVNACLANGRRKAAEFLAGRGAKLDLEGAAGVGRIDLVRICYAESTATQVQDAFAWACEFGGTPVVEFLLDQGLDPSASLKHHGQTGLHWAAGGAHLDTVQLLLDRKAPVDAQDQTWHATPLSWALYGWKNPPPETQPELYHQVVALLIAAGATVQPEWLDDPAVRAGPRMLAALTGGI
jgi:hypothetical protein